MKRNGETFQLVSPEIQTINPLEAAQRLGKNKSRVKTNVQPKIIHN